METPNFKVPLPNKLWQAAFVINLIPDLFLIRLAGNIWVALAFVASCLGIIMVVAVIERLLDRLGI